MKPLHWMSLWHPETIIFCLLLYILYSTSLTWLRKHLAVESKSFRHEHIQFVLFLIVFYAALGSPLNAAAQLHGFSYFMLQMLLMSMVMPWLFIRSIPVWYIDTALRTRGFYVIIKTLTRPTVATVVYNFVATLLLVPLVFHANLTYNWLHIVSQTVYMIASVFLWWPLASRSQILPQPGKGVQLFYILFSMNVVMPIPVLLLVAQDAWYTVYQHTLWPIAISPIADQQFGGISMLIGMGIAYGIRTIMTLLSYDQKSVWYD